MDAPSAPARPVTTHHHGHERTDDYDWLRAKDDPEVVSHLEAENAYTRERTEHLADLRRTIFEEIKARTKETDLSVPVRQRGHWYYSRSFEGREYGASCRVPVSDPDDWRPPKPAEDCTADQPALPGEEVLLDLNDLAEGHEFFSMGGSSISPDASLLAYSTDVVGDERYTVRILDLATRDLLPDTLTGVLGGVVWDREGRHLYYTTVDEAWRSDKVWRHTLGTGQTEDTLVFHETDARFWVGVGRTRSDRFVMIASGSKQTTEFRVLDSEHPEAGFEVYAERRDGLEYALEHAVVGGSDRFLVVHNGAGPDFEVGLAPITPTPTEAWEPLIAHTPGVRIEDVDAFATHLVVHQRSEGLTQLRVLDLDADGVTDDRLVAFDDALYTIGSGANPEFEQPVVRLGYTTLATPSSVYDYDVRDRSLTLVRRAEVLGGYDPGDYVEERLWAPATDVAGERAGEQTLVPVSVVRRRDAEGPIPFLLYGYGAYELSIDPYFSSARLSLLDRGVGFAIAHVRGGGEMGRAWYENGRLAHKQHTFTDFVAAARHLVASGHTRPEQLIAEGGSAGGLLIGAVLNQAPDAFGGVVAQVPFVDALTSMLDSTLPLTIGEYEEWGDPEGDPAAYDTIRAYAPYDNVAAVDYPPVLAETSLNDTRVLYVEAAKWIARLRERAVGRRDFLLKTEMSAGHGGVSGRYKAWHDRAFTLAWMLDVLGLAEEPDEEPDEQPDEQPDRSTEAPGAAEPAAV